MSKQCFNPYLPDYEYIPDGEPRVFGDRVYIYGSHDKFNGGGFCLNDYVTWSAPVGDLSDWRYEGVIYRKSDDPNYKGRGSMYAPDVCLAPDGKYYLYYAFNPGITRKSWAIRCAVADSPVGPFKYHGEVNLYGYSKEYLPFDPAVYVENGRVWLYYGSGMFFPVLGVFKKNIKGGAVVELNPEDMLTVIKGPVQTLPSNKKSGKHSFFEASSMRKINGRYYFIYSSALGHELCYAVGNSPTGPFAYGGTIVSNGDIGLRGIKGVKDAANFCGNTHGSIACDKQGRYYIFYHRQTNGHCFSRQGCAERITVEQDGSIKQVEMTSCGLNGKPLEGRGEYSASIACNLTCRKGGAFYLAFKRGGRPYFTQTGADRNDSPDQYIADISDGVKIGFKYFEFKSARSVGVNVSGKADGRFVVDDGQKTVAEISVSGAGLFTANLNIADGVFPLFFTYKGKGKCNLHSIIL